MEPHREYGVTFGKIFSAAAFELYGRGKVAIDDGKVTITGSVPSARSQMVLAFLIGSMFLPFFLVWESYSPSSYPCCADHEALREQWMMLGVLIFIIFIATETLALYTFHNYFRMPFEGVMDNQTLGSVRRDGPAISFNSRVVLSDRMEDIYLKTNWGMQDISFRTASPEEAEALAMELERISRGRQYSFPQVDGAALAQQKDGA